MERTLYAMYASKLRSCVPQLAVGLLAVASLTGCFRGAEANSGKVEQGVELASLMGELQRHSTKLGLAIRGQNQPLAAFYLEEVDEVLAEVYAAPPEDGMPIGKPAEVIMSPLIEELRTQLAGNLSESSPAAFGEMIAGCNRCHMATQHGFIEVLTAPGVSGYAQRFE